MTLTLTALCIDPSIPFPLRVLAARWSLRPSSSSEGYRAAAIMCAAELAKLGRAEDVEARIGYGLSGNQAAWAQMVAEQLRHGWVLSVVTAHNPWAALDGCRNAGCHP